MNITRAWAMPTPDTMNCQPIRAWVLHHMASASVSVDPFARNQRIATHTNDMNPDTAADYHMDAGEYCQMLERRKVVADVVLFDPPYSPRQVTECYQACGKTPTTGDTQNAALYRRIRDSLDAIVRPGGVVLSFGWNSVGMGKGRGYDLYDMLVVCHGGAHNDTICIAERKRDKGANLFDNLEAAG